MAQLVRKEEPVDDIDRRILDLLAKDGRTTNRELAHAVGLAESTVHTRVRRLEQRGVIAGYEAIVRQAHVGNGLQAIIGVTLRPGARQASISAFSSRVSELEQVSQVFFLGGVDDFIVHVAVADSSALRRFVVENLSGDPNVASTRTNILFAYQRNVSTASFE